MCPGQNQLPTCLFVGLISQETCAAAVLRGASALPCIRFDSQQDKARGTRELGVLRKWVIERGIVGYNEVLCSVLVLFVCCRVAQGPWW